MSADASIITLTTDFGTEDAYVPAMKGTMLSIAPEARLVDVTHEIGGRTITYRIEFDSTTVPFLMPELADFGCPTTLE